MKAAFPYAEWQVLAELGQGWGNSEPFPEGVPGFFVGLLTIHHSGFESDDTLSSNPGWKGCPSYQIGLVASAATGNATLTAASLLSRPGFADGERSPVVLLTIQGGNGRSNLFLGIHLDKAEALRAPRIPIHDDLGRLNRTMRFTQLLQIAVGHAIRQVADVQFLTHDGPPLRDDHARRQAHSGRMPTHENASIV
jgi:hypothetical protein